jgi:hypothetical protein
MRVLLLVPLVTSCYTYVPLETSALAPGQSLRARISGAHADQIAPLLGRSDARLITGKVISAGADTLIIEVPTTERAAVGGGFQTLNQRVAVPRVSILELESRTLDRKRTTLATVAGVVALGAILVQTHVIDPGGSRMPGDGGGPEFKPRF